MKLTPEETTDMINNVPSAIYDIFCVAVSEYGDGTREKQVEIAEFLGSLLTETVQGYTEYFAKKE